MSRTDVFVVLRAAGERTEAAARARAIAEVGADGVALIREVPFAAALRHGLEAGAAAGRRWTLCLDADMLLRPGAVDAAVAAAEAAPEAAFCLTARVADKLLCQVRPAGQHLYRTALIDKALDLGRFDPAARRPETALKTTMADAGHPNVRSEVMMGLHDFEQSFADIFRKVVAHARKHARFMPEALAVWRDRAGGDPDYRFAVIAAAVAQAIDETEPDPVAQAGAATDRRRFPDEVGALLLPAGLAEKPSLAPGAADGPWVERQLAAFVPALRFHAAPTPAPALFSRLAARLRNGAAAR